MQRRNRWLKKPAFLLALLVCLALLAQPVFAQSALSGETRVSGSDREKGQENYFNPAETSLKNPFGALKVEEEVGKPSTGYFFTAGPQLPRPMALQANQNLSLVTSNDKVSMTEAREIEVEADFGYTPDLANLEWTFGRLAFSAWKKWDSQKKAYAGEPFIYFVQEPVVEGTKVKARIKFDLVYGTVDLSPRSIRVLYPALLGTYNLAVVDKSTGTVAQKAIKLNVYDSYKTYGEIKAFIDRVAQNLRPGRYMEYREIGRSVEGRPLHFVILAKDKKSVEQYLKQQVPQMLSNPAGLQKQLRDGKLTNYKVPIFLNNIHPDESPGVDAILDVLESLATRDQVTYKTLDENQQEVTVTLDVNSVLDNIIFLFNPTENPDGRYYNKRQNANGFDVNRDNGYQTQPESRAVTHQIALWNPVSFLDFHGFVKDFLIEPCTPPHDPNYEYDLLMQGMLEQAHAMGKAGVASTKYDHYIIPLLDYKTGWDDATPAYTATYAMHHGALGHTIEIPELNQDSHDALVSAALAAAKYVTDNKKDLFINQLEYFRRGVEGIDDRAVDEWLVNSANEKVGRPRGDYDNFFPDYYVLPVDAALQKNPLQVYKTIDYLLNNGVTVWKTKTKVTWNSVTYPAGTYVVPMHQAKRGYANTVLYGGVDVSDWPEMYAEIVMNFPDLRGFNCYPVREAGVFDRVAVPVTAVKVPATRITEDVANYVIRNTNNDAVRAVNDLLARGKKVSVLLSAGNGYQAGDYLVSRKDLALVKDNYFLQVVPYRGDTQTASLRQPRVAYAGVAAGMPATQTTFVLKELGFKLVDSLKSADIIVDDGGYASKYTLTAGQTYIGLGGRSLSMIKSKQLLPGFDWAKTDFYHEGLIKSAMARDSLITAGYDAEEYLYIASGSWINEVPEGFKVLATAASGDDFFKAGWWPGHEAVQGQVLAIAGKAAETNYVLFAPDITNKAHPQHCYRLLANAIFAAVLGENARQEQPLQVIKTDPEADAKGISPGKSLRVFFNRLTVAGEKFADISMCDALGNSIEIQTKLQGDVLYITPVTPLSCDQKYTVTIPAGAIKEANAATALATDVVFSFSTRSAIENPLEIVASYPGHGAENVSRSTKEMRVVFKQNIAKGDAFKNIKLVYDYKGKQRTVVASCSIKGEVLTVRWRSHLAASTIYTLLIPAGAVTSASSSEITLPEDVNIFFTTGK